MNLEDRQKYKVGQRVRDRNTRESGKIIDIVLAGIGITVTVIFANGMRRVYEERPGGETLEPIVASAFQGFKEVSGIERNKLQQQNRYWRSQSEGWAKIIQRIQQEGSFQGVDKQEIITRLSELENKFNNPSKIRELIRATEVQFTNLLRDAGIQDAERYTQVLRRIVHENAKDISLEAAHALEWKVVQDRVRSSQLLTLSERERVARILENIESKSFASRELLQRWSKTSNPKEIQAALERYLPGVANERAREAVAEAIVKEQGALSKLGDPSSTFNISQIFDKRDMENELPNWFKELRSPTGKGTEILDLFRSRKGISSEDKKRLFGTVESPGLLGQLIAEIRGSVPETNKPTKNIINQIREDIIKGSPIHGIEIIRPSRSIGFTPDDLVFAVMKISPQGTNNTIGGIYGELFNIEPSSLTFKKVEEILGKVIKTRGLGGSEFFDLIEAHALARKAAQNERIETINILLENIKSAGDQRNAFRYLGRLHSELTGFENSRRNFSYTYTNLFGKSLKDATFIPTNSLLENAVGDISVYNDISHSTVRTTQGTSFKIWNKEKGDWDIIDPYEFSMPGKTWDESKGRWIESKKTSIFEASPEMGITVSHVYGYSVQGYESMDLLSFFSPEIQGVKDIRTARYKENYGLGSSVIPIEGELEAGEDFKRSIKGFNPLKSTLSTEEFEYLREQAKDIKSSNVTKSNKSKQAKRKILESQGTIPIAYNSINRIQDDSIYAIRALKETPDQLKGKSVEIGGGIYQITRAEAKLFDEYTSPEEAAFAEQAYTKFMAQQALPVRLQKNVKLTGEEQDIIYNLFKSAKIGLVSKSYTGNIFIPLGTVEGIRNNPRSFFSIGEKGFGQYITLNTNRFNTKGNFIEPNEQKEYPELSERLSRKRSTTKSLRIGGLIGEDTLIEKDALASLIGARDMSPELAQYFRGQKLSESEIAGYRNIWNNFLNQTVLPSYEKRLTKTLSSDEERRNLLAIVTVTAHEVFSQWNRNSESLQKFLNELAEETIKQVWSTRQSLEGAKPKEPLKFISLHDPIWGTQILEDQLAARATEGALDRGPITFKQLFNQLSQPESVSLSRSKSGVDYWNLTPRIESYIRKLQEKFSDVYWIRSELRFSDDKEGVFFTLNDSSTKLIQQKNKQLFDLDRGIKLATNFIKQGNNIQDELFSLISTRESLSNEIAALKTTNYRSLRQVNQDIASAIKGKNAAEDTGKIADKNKYESILKKLREEKEAITKKIENLTVELEEITSIQHEGLPLISEGRPIINESQEKAQRELFYRLSDLNMEVKGDVLRISIPSDRPDVLRGIIDPLTDLLATENLGPEFQGIRSAFHEGSRVATGFLEGGSEVKILPGLKGTAPILETSQGRVLFGEHTIDLTGSEALSLIAKKNASDPALNRLLKGAKDLIPDNSENPSFTIYKSARPDLRSTLAVSNIGLGFEDTVNVLERIKRQQSAKIYLLDIETGFGDKFRPGIEEGAILDVAVRPLEQDKGGNLRLGTLFHEKPLESASPGSYLTENLKGVPFTAQETEALREQERATIRNLSSTVESAFAANKEAIFGIHNVAFDLPKIIERTQRLFTDQSENLHIQTILERALSRSMETMLLFQMALPGRWNYKLEDISRSLGVIEDSQKHTAFDDLEILGESIRKSMDEARRRGINFKEYAQKEAQKYLTIESGLFWGMSGKWDEKESLPRRGGLYQFTGFVNGDEVAEQGFGVKFREILYGSTADRVLYDKNEVLLTGGNPEALTRKISEFLAPVDNLREGLNLQHVYGPDVARRAFLRRRGDDEEEGFSFYLRYQDELAELKSIKGKTVADKLDFLSNPPESLWEGKSQEEIIRTQRRLETLSKRDPRFMWELLFIEDPMKKLEEEHPIYKTLESQVRGGKIDIDTATSLITQYWERYEDLAVGSGVHPFHQREASTVLPQMREISFHIPGLGQASINLRDDPKIASDIEFLQRKTLKTLFDKGKIDEIRSLSTLEDDQFSLLLKQLGSIEKLTGINKNLGPGLSPTKFQSLLETVGTKHLLPGIQDRFASLGMDKPSSFTDVENTMRGLRDAGPSDPLYPALDRLIKIPNRENPLMGSPALSAPTAEGLSIRDDLNTWAMERLKMNPGALLTEEANKEADLAQQEAIENSYLFRNESWAGIFGGIDVRDFDALKSTALADIKSNINSGDDRLTREMLKANKNLEGEELSTKIEELYGSAAERKVYKFLGTQSNYWEISREKVDQGLRSYANINENQYNTIREHLSWTAEDVKNWINPFGSSWMQGSKLGELKQEQIEKMLNPQGRYTAQIRGNFKSTLQQLLEEMVENAKQELQSEAAPIGAELVEQTTKDLSQLKLAGGVAAGIAAGVWLSNNLGNPNPPKDDLPRTTLGSGPESAPENRRAVKLESNPIYKKMSIDITGSHKNDVDHSQLAESVRKALGVHSQVQYDLNTNVKDNRAKIDKDYVDNLAQSLLVH